MAFLDEQPDGAYLIYLVRASDIERSWAVASNSLAEIDAYHETFKRTCWDEQTELELLVEFSGV